MVEHKKHVIDTNFNGKLANDGFIHIDRAPVNSIPESRLQATTIELATKDGSHPPVLVKLVDLARFKFKDLPSLASCLTWCSHAMYSWDLASWFLRKYQDIEPGTECAIYFYQKIKNPS